MTEHHGGEASPDTATTGQLVARLGEQVSDLVRSEMELARADLTESVRHAGLGAGLVGGAGVVALYGLGVLVAAAVLALALVVDAWLAALLVAVVLFLVAGAVALVGRRQVAQAPPPVRRSVASVRTDVETLRDRRSHPGAAASTTSEEQ
ncbi:MAG: phage holin family protein [Micrococcales bacterium]|nr:phage holin family protein [Micrococcales bacterium]